MQGPILVVRTRPQHQDHKFRQLQPSPLQASQDQNIKVDDRNRKQQASKANQKTTFEGTEAALNVNMAASHRLVNDAKGATSSRVLPRVQHW